MRFSNAGESKRLAHWVLVSRTSRAQDRHRKGDVSVLSSPLLWSAAADRRGVCGTFAQRSRDPEHRSMRSGIRIRVNLTPDSRTLPFSR